MKENLLIVVLEDETQAWEKLRRLIIHRAPQATLVWLRTVAEAQTYLAADHHPDLIFSDIELLDGNAFRVYEQITPACPIIFCTAFDTFLVEAFKTSGIAYLLKPFSETEFGEAWDKFNLLFPQADPVPAVLFRQLSSYLQQQRQSYKELFTVKFRDNSYLLPVAEIACFQAQGDFVLAIDQSGKKHMLNFRLAHIAATVDPSMFFQINRSELVNFSCIRTYENYIKNRLAIQLKTPAMTLYTSNSRTAGFREWLAGR